MIKNILASNTTNHYTSFALRRRCKLQSSYCKLPFYPWIRDLGKFPSSNMISFSFVSCKWLQLLVFSHFTILLSYRKKPISHCWQLSHIAKLLHGTPVHEFLNWNRHFDLYSYPFGISEKQFKRILQSQM